MFEIFGTYHQEYTNASSWLTPFAQCTSAIAATFALVIARNNLNGVKKSQALQGQMNLISLENEMRKNSISYRKIVDDYTKAKNVINLEELSRQRFYAFELYVTSADKIAALINSEFLATQFPNRDWKAEYKEIFTNVIAYFDGEDILIPGKSQMIRNITALISKWDKT